MFLGTAGRLGFVLLVIKRCRERFAFAVIN